MFRGNEQAGPSCLAMRVMGKVWSPVFPFHAILFLMVYGRVTVCSVCVVGAG